MKRFKYSLHIATYTISVVIIILATIGWVLNIMQLFTSTFDPLTGEVLLKIIGIFLTPLGAVLGWI